MKKTSKKFADYKKSIHLCARFSKDVVLMRFGRFRKGEFFLKKLQRFFAGIKKVFTFAARFGKTECFEGRKFIERMEEK
ncbi:MAG: hypothetical protein J5699_02920 [Bacteroidales bacterium]|nr:hypothetical protein [Bacteroidales bacterium]